MIGQNEFKTGLIGVDETTMRQIMGYYRVWDHEVLVRYIKNLGISHSD